MLIAPPPNLLVWIDNQFVPWDKANIHITAHHYAFGVFEGVRSYATEKGAAIFRLEAHTERLFHSAHILGIQIPYTKNQLNDAQCEIIKRNQLQNAYIRPYIFHDGLMGLSLYTDMLKVHTAIIAVAWNQKNNQPQDAIKGVTLHTSSIIRNHANSTFLKAKANANYINSIMALQEARAYGADDALLLDHQGYVAEASGANIFMVRNSTLYTPELISALPGITRDTIFTLAAEMGLTVKEKNITRDELYIADEAFLTGTAAEIIPIFEVDKRKIGMGQIGPITKQLRKLYLGYVHGHLSDKYHWLTSCTSKAICEL